ncbi:ABC transporter permease subunit [Bacillus sp. REN16]|uniref:ABC transporter permease subunit n=1 Tax=Bacillus sp. REN16 TaxID=2887296 RepID=UPI001E427143|nr:ABC transporter permease subunit [Bacillus sp. REN16]MCC3357848.1 ABC transporter permease subunit [Bacillus sp. REN16]
MRIRTILFQLWSLTFLLILGTLPLVVFSGKDKVIFQIERIPKEIIPFLEGLFDGSSYYYLDGERELNFFHIVGGYFLSSLIYLLIAGVFVIVLSIIFGIWFRRRSEKGLHPIIGFIGLIPDFVLVFLLQLLVIYIYETTGWKTVRVASSNMDEPAIVLPLITLFILPFVYLVRSLRDKSSDVLTEDYIRTALSKGFRKRYIYLYHVTPNVIPFLKADLHKVVSIMIGNLFIIEYLYNYKGLTSMLFPMRFEYQYNLFILCFLSFFILYITVYFTMKLIVILIERTLKHAHSL